MQKSGKKKGGPLLRRSAKSEGQGAIAGKKKKKKQLIMRERRRSTVECGAGGRRREECADRRRSKGKKKGVPISASRHESGPLRASRSIGGVSLLCPRKRGKAPGVERRKRVQLRRCPHDSGEQTPCGKARCPRDLRRRSGNEKKKVMAIPRKADSAPVAGK